jgi:hypothetical protein
MIQKSLYSDLTAKEKFIQQKHKKRCRNNAEAVWCIIIRNILSYRNRFFCEFLRNHIRQGKGRRDLKASGWRYAGERTGLR